MKIHSTFHKVCKSLLVSGFISIPIFTSSSVFAAELPTIELESMSDDTCEWTTEETDACAEYFSYDAASGVLDLKTPIKALSISNFDNLIIGNSSDITVAEVLEIESSAVEFRGPGKLVVNGDGIYTEFSSLVFSGGSNIVATRIGGTVLANLGAITIEEGSISTHFLSGSRITMNNGALEVTSSSDYSWGAGILGTEVIEFNGGTTTIKGFKSPLDLVFAGIVGIFYDDENATSIKFNGGTVDFVDNLVAFGVMQEFDDPSFARDLSSTISFGPKMGIVQEYTTYTDILDLAKTYFTEDMLQDYLTDSGLNDILAHIQIYAVTNPEKHITVREIPDEAPIENPSTSDHIIFYIAGLAAVVVLGFCGKRFLARH